MSRVTHVITDVTLNREIDFDPWTDWHLSQVSQLSTLQNFNFGPKKFWIKTRELTIDWSRALTGHRKGMWCNLGWNADDCYLLFVIRPHSSLPVTLTLLPALSACISRLVSAELSGICLVLSCNKVIRTVDILLSRGQDSGQTTQWLDKFYN